MFQLPIHKGDCNAHNPSHCPPLQANGCMYSCTFSGLRFKVRAIGTPGSIALAVSMVYWMTRWLPRFLSKSLHSASHPSTTTFPLTFTNIVQNTTCNFNFMRFSPCIFQPILQTEPSSFQKAKCTLPSHSATTEVIVKEFLPSVQVACEWLH